MDEKKIYEVSTQFGHYIVADRIYRSRPARVLYSNKNRGEEQSGIARDDNPELLFDYNERFMELIRGLEPKKILLLGGGAFTLPKAIIDEFPALIIDIVEIDKTMLAIGRTFFEFKPSNLTKIYINDAEEFIKKTKDLYDLILIDLFFGPNVPKFLQSGDCMGLLARHLNKKGTVAMNLIAAYHGSRSGVLKHQIAVFQEIFRNVELFPAEYSLSLWLPQNFIITAHNGRKNLVQYLRYGPIQLPKI